MLFFFSANLYYSSTSPYSKMLTPQHQPPDLREVPTFYTPVHFQEIHRLSWALFPYQKGEREAEQLDSLLRMTHMTSSPRLILQAPAGSLWQVPSSSLSLTCSKGHFSVQEALLAGVQYLTEMLDAPRNFSHSSNIILLGFCLFSPFTFASTKLLPFPPISYIQTLETETMSLQNTQFSVLATSFYSHPLNSSSVSCHSNLNESLRCHLG